MSDNILHLRDYTPLDQRASGKLPTMQEQPVTEPIRFNAKLADREEPYVAPPSDCA